MNFAIPHPTSFSPANLQADLNDWFTLLKPRVVGLVVFTGLVGLLVAPNSIGFVVGFTAVVCIAVAAGAAGAINMWYDRDIDSVMRRTARRPIPGGRIKPSDALSFGVVLAFGSVLTMFLATNAVAAGLLATSVLFYVFVYTICLKRRSPQNIVIGGAAGAFPPLIGWAAVTGGLDTLPVVLFFIILLWTPPHFWALSLYAHADYERAGVPMLPVAMGARSTRRYILTYTICLVVTSLLPYCLGDAGVVYGTVASALGAWFMVCALRVLLDSQDGAGRSVNDDVPARSMFRFSLAYLFTLFAALALDMWVR